MTEIEETVSRILAAEADRHEPPVFDAYRIAGAATAKRRRWRPALFALVAAVIGAGGVGGAAVLASGGHDNQGPRPPFLGQAVVTFQSRAGSPDPQATDTQVLSWVYDKAEAEGMTTINASVSHDPWRLQVIGRAADLDRLKELGGPVILQFRPVVAGEAAPATLPDYHVAATVTEQLAESPSDGTDIGWAVQIGFDDQEKRTFATFMAQNSDKLIEILVDGVPCDTIRPQKPDGGWFLFPPETSQQQAQEFSSGLISPAPVPLAGAIMTVSTR